MRFFDALLMPFSMLSSNSVMRFLIAFAISLLLAGCATQQVLFPADLEAGQLPVADVKLEIPGLGPCTDSPDRSLRINSREPITVLVHGCFGSSGEFRALAQVMAFHGQQAACFTYDDRAKLDQSASELRQALTQLSQQTSNTDFTLVGHSQGALISRKSVTEALPTPLLGKPAALRLVTISGPFAGIQSAHICGKDWLFPLTLGLLPLSCHIATGPKWADITYSSTFIREPSTLSSTVARHLKINTDERESCRRFEGGRCVEDDDIFSLAEQQNPLVEADARVQQVTVKAGHVEIIGDKQVAPTKLINVLQEQNIIHHTAPKQVSAFQALLARLY